MKGKYYHNKIILRMSTLKSVEENWGDKRRVGIFHHEIKNKYFLHKDWLIGWLLIISVDRNLYELLNVAAHNHFNFWQFNIIN